MKDNLKEILIIIIITISLSAIRYFFIKDDFDLIKQKKNVSEISDTLSDDKDDLKEMIYNLSNVTVIDFSLALKIYNKNLATFIDARSIDSFLEGHINGAINIPFDDIENIEKQCDLIFMNDIGDDYICNIGNEEDGVFVGIKNGKKFIKSDYNDNSKVNLSETVFVIYCSGEGCSLSEDLAFYMFDLLGFKKILVYEGGILEWNNNKLPIK